MKRTNAPPIPEGIRITLNGEEQEWKDVMQVFEDAGWVWVSGTKPHEKKICSYSTVETSSKKKIANCACVPITQELTPTEFLNQYQGTIKYESGDWVVILKDQSGVPEDTVTQVVHVDGDSVYAKNISRSGTSITNWSVHISKIRPATPEEIPYDTKVASEDPDVYIWDGDVLPDEYWVENPNKATCEIAQYLKLLPGGEHWNGDRGWYKVTPNNVEAHEHKEKGDIIIVPYELWKSILEQPVSQAEPVKERMFEKGDRVKVVRGSYEGYLGVVDIVGKGPGLYYVSLDSGDDTVILFSGEGGTGVDIVHYTEEPVAITPTYHIDNVMDQNIAISCPTIELWNAVTGLIPNNSLTEENWKDYNSNDEIAGCNINQFGGNHCDIDWYKDEKYTIITAEEFLRDNGVAVSQSKWSIVTTDGVRVYEGDKAWWLYPDGKKWFGDETNEGDILTKGSVVDHIVLGYKAFSTYEAAEKYRQEQLGSSSTVKENIVPIGWKPGDSWRHKDGTCGLSISVYPKDGNPNMYFIDYAENATAWVEVNVINEFVAKGLWIINPDQKSKQEEKSQTIINKQSKTKQNEKGNSISITEQCIVINSNYINCKTSNATYVPGDEERITKGQRRQGSAVRG